MSVTRLLLFWLIQQLNTPIFCKRVSGFYANNGYNQTILLKVPSQKQRIELEGEMLYVFDISEKPHIQDQFPLVKRSASTFLMNVYKMLNEKETAKSSKSFDHNWDFFGVGSKSLNSIRKSNMIMALTAQNHKAIGVTESDKVKTLWFNVSHVSPKDEIIRAELKLYRNLQSVQNKIYGPITITIYQVTTARVEDGSRGKLLIDSVNTSKEDGWVTLDITESLHYWAHSSDVNLGFYLLVHAENQSYDKEMKLEEFGIVGFRDDPEKQPFLVTFCRRTREIKKRKTNYSLLNLENVFEDVFPTNVPSTICSRQSLYINFKDLNWQNWIIQPPGFEAYFCEGQCDFKEDMKATNHALVQALVHLKDSSNAPNPECSASELTSFFVTYCLDDENYALRNFEEMLVESCACQ